MILSRFWKFKFCVYTFCALLVLSTTPAVLACTSIQLTAKDGSVIYGRTLEFGFDLKSDVIVIPRGYARTGLTPDGKKGLQWKSKYASVGVNSVGLPILIDGLNEKGLAIGSLYFPGSVGYMPYNPADPNNTISQLDVGSWILDNFATVEEVRENIDKVLVSSVVIKGLGFAPPLHYVVHDEAGNSIVIEHVGGKVHVHDNPLGIMTNSPTFDWHMTNLRNYVNFSFTNLHPVELGPIKLTALGEGSGMLGLPGDFTPPSRFIRAAAFSQSALPSETGSEAVLQSFHILNNFDIPKGLVRSGEKDKYGNIKAEYTFWTSASDLKTKRFYFHTYENSQIRMIDLMAMDLDAKNITSISMKGEQVIKQLK